MIGEAYQDRVALLGFSLSVGFSIFVVRFFAKTFCTLIFKTPTTVFAGQTKIFNKHFLF